MSPLFLGVSCRSKLIGHWQIKKLVLLFGHMIRDELPSLKTGRSTRKIKAANGLIINPVVSDDFFLQWLSFKGFKNG
jgi:hypothetical protein